MIRLITGELLKLRTTRLSYGLLAAASVLTAGFSVLEAARAGPTAVAPLSTTAGFDAIATGGIWSLLFAAVLGVTVSSGEFRHSTATATYLAEPKRGRVLTAKAAAAACGGAVFGFTGWLIATGIGLGFVAADGDHLPVAGTIARYAAGHLLAGALLAAIGVAIGSLVRSQLAAVIGVLVWSIVAESVLGGLFNAVQPYLPYTAATTLAGSVLAAPRSARRTVRRALPRRCRSRPAAALPSCRGRHLGDSLPDYCQQRRQLTGEILMAKPNVIVNPLSGEQISIVRTARDTSGQVLDWELRLAPGGRVPSSHAHPEQQETFTVLEGTMRFRVGWRRVTAQPGQRVIVPPGTVHHFANACQAAARVAA